MENFLKEVKDKKKLIALFLSGFLILLIVYNANNKCFIRIYFL